MNFSILNLSTLNFFTWFFKLNFRFRVRVRFRVRLSVWLRVRCRMRVRFRYSGWVRSGVRFRLYSGLSWASKNLFFKNLGLKNFELKNSGISNIWFATWRNKNSYWEKSKTQKKTRSDSKNIFCLSWIF